MSFHEIKSENELQPLLDSGKLVVIDFSASWCGPCRMIGPFFHDLHKDAAYANVIFVKVGGCRRSLCLFTLMFSLDRCRRMPGSCWKFLC